MRYLLTICSKNKSLVPEPIPAYLRYLSPRITTLREESAKSSIPGLLLSGKFGILQIDDLVPYYDHLLALKEVDQLVLKVSQQLTNLDATEITAFMKPRTTPNWSQYYLILEKACAQAKIKLNYHA